nr:hypothetical protein [Haliscomenobacter sp.]
MRIFLSILALVTLTNFALWAQKDKKVPPPAAVPAKAEKPTVHQSSTYSGLSLRSIGPAVTSGRVSDFAVNPRNHAEYYVATSSGGVWKTNNAGTTWVPIFDGQGSYSIGCVALDPSNPSTVWVGSGENNNQRAVSYGDGVYKSENGGKTWRNMGLKASEHIANVVVDPSNSNIVYVAAYGPVWSDGGERGVYKSTDGGETWTNVKSVSAYTGCSNLIMDPRNPQVLYAAFHQRQRKVYTYIGGGPESALYKTTDGGATWKKLDGLPGGDVGRIGIDLSPANPDYVYAVVEASEGKGGVYRSTDRGASWEKMSGVFTSGNYYQELTCDPRDVDRIFITDSYYKVSDDGGKTVRNLGEINKHIDNHCIWIDPGNTNHLRVGCDGGIYESWDFAKSWEFKHNLPVTQFYKVATDNGLPFYHVHGGTQDNLSLGGPSRTTSDNGITNADWYVTSTGDGFETQVDQTNPDIVYAQSQYGGLSRFDRKSGQSVFIKPLEGENEPALRWNWDAPLTISNFSSTRVYFGANKVFRTDKKWTSCLAYPTTATCTRLSLHATIKTALTSASTTTATATLNPTCSKPAMGAKPGNPSAPLCRSEAVCTASPRITSIPTCCFVAPSLASFSPKMAAKPGFNSSPVCPPLRCATSTSSAAKTTWSSLLLAVASTSWMTIRPYGTSKRKLSIRRRPSSR